MWSLLSIYVTAKVIDKILSGGISERIVHVVSEHSNSIGQAISKELERGSTILNGQNLTNHENKKVLLVVVAAREIQKLKNIISEHDKQAIVIIMDASEMKGSSLLIT